MAYDHGDIAVARLEVSPADGTTDATVLVKAPDGTQSTPTPQKLDGGALWTVQVPLTQPGAWHVIWTVTGTGAGAETDEIMAEPLPPATAEQRRVRLLINDTNPGERFFATIEIDDFLAMNGGSVRRAAAQALDVIAANEALVSKKIRTQDLSTDGPAVAKELREQAKELRRQADTGEDDADSTGFEIAEFTPYYHPHAELTGL